VEKSKELKHFGIPGMHWGIRRYQEPDGSYTDSGKKRYISDAKAGAKEKSSKRWDVAKARHDMLNSPEGKVRIKKGLAIVGGILATVGALTALNYGLKKSTDGIGLKETGELAVAALRIQMGGKL
jgi:hypothetical protein